MSDLQLALGDGYPGIDPGKRENVKELQQLLRQWGYAGVTASGQFDAVTDDAVQHFQRFKRLSVDGQVGPATWRALRQAPTPAVGAGWSPPDYLHGVPWFSQFDEAHISAAKITAQSGCFDAAKVMMRASGINNSGTGLIQVALKEDAEGAVTAIDPKALQQAVAYIDGELNRNRPVMVGVSYSHKDHNSDHMTDHFVVIKERKQDAQGVRYYYNDPAVNKSLVIDATTHYFELDSSNGNLVHKGNSLRYYAIQKTYYLTQVLRNAK